MLPGGKFILSVTFWDVRLFKINRVYGCLPSVGRARLKSRSAQGVYEEFKYLKRDVIIKPVAEINRISDIQLVPEFQKQGRKVTAVRFLITENPQQTLLKPVIEDDHEAIRETEVFKRLLEHGIGERLAILWTLQDEERAQKVVEYVEARARKKQVKGSTAGLSGRFMKAVPMLAKRHLRPRRSR